MKKQISNLYKKGNASQMNPSSAPNKVYPKKTFFQRKKSKVAKLPKLKYVPEGGKNVMKPVNKFKYNKGCRMI